VKIGHDGTVDYAKPSTLDHARALWVERPEALSDPAEIYRPPPALERL
jgi:hypothetical protein